MECDIVIAHNGDKPPKDYPICMSTRGRW